MTVQNMSPVMTKPVYITVMSIYWRGNYVFNIFRRQRFDLDADFNESVVLKCVHSLLFFPPHHCTSCLLDS